MSAYLVLARKYRPKRFADVIGQEVVTEVLRGALTGGHLGHAYLFAGPRGTGKTTLARIFAKCLNCEKGPTAEPCGSCERCLATESGNEVDVIELDAASHTGVDNIRELRDEVAYAPMRARYKVYIVDEVHMLTKNAFNALLKTLEEPPPHVVFLFATTDPHKVLDTVLSRCQILRLAPISEESIAPRLEQVFAAEGVRVGAGVVPELARRAHGGMRDALSQADKLLAFAGNEPSLEDLLRLGGDAGSRELEALLALVESGDRPALLLELAKFEGDEEEVLEGLLGQVRSAALLAFCGESTPLVTLGGHERTLAAERGRRLGAERLELWLHELLRARERLRLLPGQERVLLELCLLDLARSDQSVPLGELVLRLEALEKRLAGGAASARPSALASAPAARAPTAAAASPRAAQAAPGPSLASSAGSSHAAPGSAVPPHVVPHHAVPPQPIGNQAAPRSPSAPGAWEAFLAELGRGHGALATLFSKHGASSLGEAAGGRLRLALSGLSSEEQRLVGDKRNQRACDLACTRVFGRGLDFALSGAPAPLVERASTSKDPLTQRVVADYDGTVEELP